LAEIDSLASDDHGCYASNAHFAKRLGVTESRANHVLARLTREGYIVRVCCDGRLTQRVVAPQYSSNPITSRRLIEQHRRLAKNSSSELSRAEDSIEQWVAEFESQPWVSPSPGRSQTRKDSMIIV
jgi:DNA-binding IclR family transcriptional regulator